jgi:hypothetical protein
MQSSCFVCLLLAGLACAQTAPPATAAAPGAKAETAAVQAPVKVVAPEETVLTVKGICADSSKQGADCKTAISRAQFEKLADALQPNMSPPIRRQLATAYTRALLMSAAAEKRGLDKTPKFEEMIRFYRMQVLSGELSRTLQEESGKLTDADYQEYYSKNAPNFEQADLLKIFIPRAKQVTSPKPDAKAADIQAQQKASEEEMTKFAATLRERAAKGEDFDKLQKDAFAEAGMKGTSPETKINKARRTTLPPKHAAVFDLKAGEVSELISDPGGHYIYKVVSKQTMPLDSVKDEIRGTLSAQRYRDAMQGFQKADNADLNDAYFGVGPKAPTTMPARGGKAPAKDDQDPD